MDNKTRKFIKELLLKPRLRKESGLYVVDGPKMCSELSAEETETVYVTEEFLNSPHASAADRLLREKGYEIVAGSDMKQISDTVTPQGIMAVVKQKRIRGFDDFLEQSSGKLPLIVMLETLQDPGNLGTIIRASEAAGVTGVIMNSTCVDIYSPKVVRSTMGAILRVPFITVDDLCGAAERLRSRNISVFAAHLKGAVDYYKADFSRPSAFMIGNESKGLTDALAEKADCRIKIPMKGSVESLNAAMAAAIIMFEASRQRAQD